LYGFLLEWLTIKQLGDYHYGRFLVMVDGAPLAVALGWAVIIYSSMRFSNQIELPESARPILDALMALNIDLALDAIAIRLGMWAWVGVGLDQQWFGVPWANFWAWFIVVWAYSGFIRALRPWKRFRFRRWLYPPFAILLSLLTLTAASEMYRVMSNSIGNGAIASLLLLVGSLIIVLNLKPHVSQSGLTEPVAIAIPIIIHLFATTVGYYSGMFGKQPILGVVALSMLVLGTTVHLLPWWVRRLRQI
jgi:hypothetical protein